MTTPSQPHNPEDWNNGSATPEPNYTESSYTEPNYTEPGYTEPGFTEPQYSTADTAGYVGFENQQPVEKPSTLALVALIFGLLCIPAAFVLLSFIPGVIGLILAIIALVINRKRPKAARRTWMSVVGLVLSVLGIAVSVVAFTALSALFGDCVGLEGAALEQCLTDAVETTTN